MFQEALGNFVNVVGILQRIYSFFDLPTTLDKTC